MRQRLQIAVLGLVAVGLTVAAVASVRTDLATPVDVAASTYVQSETCQRCHEENYASWRRTFHRTMTQEATPEAVVGDFASRTFTYEGVTSRMTRAGDASSSRRWTGTASAELPDRAHGGLAARAAVPGARGGPATSACRSRGTSRRGTGSTSRGASWIRTARTSTRTARCGTPTASSATT